MESQKIKFKENLVQAKFQHFQENIEPRELYEKILFEQQSFVKDFLKYYQEGFSVLESESYLEDKFD